MGIHVEWKGFRREIRLTRLWEQEATKFPDWGKMQFYEYPAKTWEEILPGVEVEARELVRGLVRYQSGDRLRAEEVSSSWNCLGLD